MIDHIGTTVSTFSALASATFAFLLFKVTVAIRDIERQRDRAEDPLVYLFFHGYGEDNAGHFTLQNSGKRPLFLSSIKISVSNAVVQVLSLNGEALYNTDTARDVTVFPDKPLTVRFKPKGASGMLRFEILFQLYTGDPVRLCVDPTIFNGYVIRAPRSEKLEIQARAYQG